MCAFKRLVGIVRAPMTEDGRRQWADPRWAFPLCVILLALTVRILFVLEVRHSVIWRVPLVDAQAYDNLAVELSEKGFLSPYPGPGVPFTPYYQPPLYPLLLAVLYRVFGHAVILVKYAQHLLGALSCVLLYFLGKKLFGPKTGLYSGLAMAVTAPLFYYESMLLLPSLLIFLNLCVLLLCAEAGERSVWKGGIAGLLTGLSIVARPDMLIFVPFLLFCVQRGPGASGTSRRRATAVFVLLAGVALPLCLTAARNRIVGNDNVLISYNGGLNFYLGNNPDLDSTLSIRPGLRWVQLTAWPLREGARRPSERNAFFFRRAFEAMTEHPGGAVMNFARKFLWVWRGPEVRRNEDEYFLTGQSMLYRLLLWRWGWFGFPFSLIAALAPVGMALSIRRVKSLLPLYGYIFAQTLMMVLFFPSSRYRAPMVPILILFAVAGVCCMADLARRRKTAVVAAILGVSLLFQAAVALSPPRFEGTPSRIDSGNLLLLGSAYDLLGRMDQAIAAYRKAVELDPDNPDPRQLLAEAYRYTGDREAAQNELAIIRKIAPDLKPAIDMLNPEGR
jgi:4-amino-4-deoxy-L-arabinose transferase-like glycosyltransferase